MCQNKLVLYFGVLAQVVFKSSTNDGNHVVRHRAAPVPCIGTHNEIVHTYELRIEILQHHQHMRDTPGDSKTEILFRQCTTESPEAKAKAAIAPCKRHTALAVFLMCEPPYLSSSLNCGSMPGAAATTEIPRSGRNRSTTAPASRAISSPAHTSHSCRFSSQ